MWGSPGRAYHPGVADLRIFRRREPSDPLADDLVARARDITERRRRRDVWAAAPRRDEGWEPAPPDFAGLGAMRCGTSRWYQLISQHPKVHHGPWRTKESHYLSGPGIDDPISDAQVERYLEMFARPPGTIAGEWTVEYLPVERALRALHRIAPDIRLIVSLRDPVERYHSEIHRLATYFTPGTNAGTHRPLHRGFYHRQLMRVLEFFDRDQLLLLQYERCVRDPVPELEKTFRHIGLEPEVRPQALTKRVSGGGDREDLAAEERELLVEMYRPEVEAIARDFPEIDVDLWANFR